MRAPRNKSGTILLLFAALATSRPAGAQDQALFRGGTRLVEVDVVVRDKNGPVRGLTKDDFTLFDCTASERSATQRFAPCKGKRQPLEVFREINANTSPARAPLKAPAISLAPGAVSNRVYSDGKPLTSATVVLLDQLNTPFELKAYERLGVIKYLQSLGDKNHIALYSLGQNLHILQDFTDDPRKLIDSMAKLDSGDQLTLAADDGGSGFGALESQAIADAKRDISIEAIQKIIQHMEGVPGRKSLVWIGQGLGGIFNPPYGPPVARNLLGAANIEVYPVMVRSLLGSGAGAAGSRALPAAPGGAVLEIQNQQRKFAQTLGGSGFNDAAEIKLAVDAAEDDADNYYVLGFYPSEKDLDGGTHQLTLEVAKKVAKRPELFLSYRQVYLAAKPSAAAPDEITSVGDLFRSPLDATKIGLAAAIVPDPATPSGRMVRATVDLGDIQLRREGGRLLGSFQMSTRFESKDGESKGPGSSDTDLKEADVLLVTQPIVQTISLSLTDAEFTASRASWYLVTQPMPEGLKPGAVHIVVQDAANGAAGSVRIPMPDAR